jgi:hypothetical protein
MNADDRASSPRVKKEGSAKKKGKKTNRNAEGGAPNEPKWEREIQVEQEVASNARRDRRRNRCFSLQIEREDLQGDEP